MPVRVGERQAGAGLLHGMVFHNAPRQKLLRGIQIICIKYDCVIG